MPSGNNFADLWEKAWEERAEEEDESSLICSAWEYATRYHRNNRGERLSFEGRHYLVEPYKILRPDFLTRRVTVWKKSPQVGVSEQFICAILALAGELGWRVMYVLDKQETRNRFVQDRINKCLRRVPHYRRLLEEARGEAHSIMRKDFGKGFLAFLASQVESEFIEMSADLVVIDELDRCDQQNILLAQDRLLARESKGSLAKISTPTYEGFGISAAYDESTQHSYRLPCPKCGKSQELRWEPNIARWNGDDWELLDRDWSPDAGRDIRVFCAWCGNASNELDRSLPGEWRPRKPNAQVIGYHIPKIIDPSVEISRAWSDWVASRENAKARETWWNRWLGLGHSETGSRLTPEVLDRCVGRDEGGRGYRMPEECDGPAVAGVDVGVNLHVAITDESQSPSPFVFLGRLPVKFRELVRLFRRYGVKAVVFDADPEKTLIKGWCRKLRRLGEGRIRAWRCRYRDDDLGEMQIDHTESLVKPDRTMSLDDSHEDFTAEVPRVALPADYRGIDQGRFVEEMGRPVRVVEERRGRAVAVWKKNPPEDFRHAVNYCHLARRLIVRFGGHRPGSIRGGGKRVYGGEVEPPAVPGEAGTGKRKKPPRRRRGIVGVPKRGPSP